MGLIPKEPDVEMKQQEPESGVPRVVGLTGGIASGKSSVSRLLRAMGAMVIDADSVGHGVIAPGGAAFDQVLKLFGDGILAGGGSIDRRALGSIVFGDPALLRELNAITHPQMARIMAGEIGAAKALAPDERPRLIVLDAAILLEAGWDELCDEVWVVSCRPETAIRRLRERDGLSPDEAKARLGAQMSNQQRERRGGRVIQNDGDQQALRLGVERLVEEMAAAGREIKKQQSP